MGVIDNIGSSLTSSGSVPLLPAGLAQTAMDTNSVPDKGNDPWWVYTDAGGQYPIYQLMVVKGVRGASRGREDNELGYAPYFDGTTSWQFTLPIPPESLTVSMPFAIDVKATLDGIVEEHGGAPFRIISLSGTTGVQPLRENALQGSQDRTVNVQPGVIPAGTIQAVASVVDTALRFVPTPNLMPLALLGDTFGSIGKGSGYYQFRLLQLFLERYAAIKQTAEGRDLRLALCMWKDQATYLITPTSFDLNRSVGSGALSYNYRFTAKAWRRISMTSPSRIFPLPVATGGLGLFFGVLETISAARDTLIKLQGVVGAVRGDVDMVLFEPLREIVLLAKDAVGTALVLADLPRKLIEDSQASLKELGESIGLKGPSANGVDLRKPSTSQSGVMSSNKAGNPKAPESFRPGEGRGALSTKAFDNPLASHAVFSKIETRKVRFAPQSQVKLAEELKRVRGFRRNDFIQKQAQIQSVANDFADAIGQGSTTFDEITGHISRPATRVATDEDFEALWAMNDAIMAFNKLMLTDESTSASLNAIDYVAGLARANGIAFITPTSKFAVPFPYGGGLERLAAQYLGDPNRWHEIAALNGLRAPYVDETGFELTLLTNGSGNTVTVSDTTNLFVGQSVTLSSTSAQRVQRRITGIARISAGFYQVSLSGDPDLDDFSISDTATLHAYLPDTVNSNQQIFIPSTKSVNPDLISRDVPGLASYQTILDAGGVDIALTSSGDIVVTPDGDTPWVVGLANLIQRVRILFSLPRGSLIQHPGIGLAIPVGMSTADLSAQQMLEASRNLFAQDSDFSGVFYAKVAKNGPIAQHIVHVGVTGSEQLLPVGFDIVR